MTVPLDLRSQVLVVLAGVVAGMVLALLAWLGTQAQPGTLLYWALGGAGVGAAIGVKLWTFAEK
jgi:hypothetical protein